MDEFIGIVKIFAGTFAPRGWMLCQGQLLSIAQNSALFSILGTTYGGDGRTTFALPNLCGLVPVGVGTSPVSRSTFVQGQVSGSEGTTLSIANLPPHAHNPKIHASTSNAAYSQPKSTSVIAAPGKPAGRDYENTNGFVDGTPDVVLASTSVTEDAVGGGQALNIMQPYLAINYIICTEGIYPPRP